MPDLVQLKKTINSIIYQVDYCFIINNGEESFEFVEYRNLSVTNLGKNYGIAYAQNIGIKQAIKYSAKFVILSDQDTAYPENFVKNNLSAYDFLKVRNITALVPVFYDIEKNLKSPIMLTKFSYTMDYSLQYVETAQAISSGSFIVTDTLKKIGLMNEALFIDYVDFEWCWRAVGLGYKIFTIPKIVINHRLGERVKKIGNSRLFIRNETRYFYIIRNGCYLAFYSPWLNIHERILLLKRVLVQIFAIIILGIKPHFITVIVRAVYEGLTGRMRCIPL